MEFLDSVKLVKGHLTILKLDHRTGNTEVLHDYPNVITNGLRVGIARMMTVSGCAEEICEGTQPEECGAGNYLIQHYQVGTGADAQDALSSTKALANPLKDEDYGDPALRNVDIEEGHLYSPENEYIDTQSFGVVSEHGYTSSNFVTFWSLNEDTANGQLLDEAGLFVYDPFLHEKFKEAIPDPAINFGLLGSDAPEQVVESTSTGAGHVLAAYKQFTPILKENYFTLLFRWTLTFSVNR